MGTILIVEDEPFVRMMAEATAQALGLKPICAADGETAITLARAAETLDILFTDIQMPPGPDGWVVARAVREIHPDVWVVYTSGQVGTEECGRFGVPQSWLLPKPYTMDELSAAIAGPDGGSPPSPATPGQSS